MLRRQLLLSAAAAILAALTALVARAEPGAPRLELPTSCILGAQCFVQQWPDMDGGPGVADPFCGHASYDGHDGIDIRLRSLADIGRGVPVTAAAPGTVRGVRDGMADVLVDSEAKRRAVANVECGNGVVIDHGEGWETQYCHMRRGSLSVRAGEHVDAGAKLGEIGASGLAQFPHVHLSVRQGGGKLDPVSGRTVGGGCVAAAPLSGTLFAPEAAAKLAAGGSDVQLIDWGMSGAPVDYARLVVDGAPPPPTGRSPVTLGWGWFVNLRKGDRIAFRLLAPSGAVFFEGEGEPAEGDKASYSAFAGRRRPPEPGPWRVTAEVLRGGQTVLSRTRTLAVAP